MFQVDRRNFLSISTSLALAPALSFGADKKQKEKSVIFVYLSGGISHADFTHPIMNVQKELQPVHGMIGTKAGFNLAGDFTGLAERSKHITLVKSLHHRDANHSTAAAWILTSKAHTGVAEGGALKEPSYGSMVSQFTGTMTPIGIPTYIKVNKIDYGARRDGSAWLGTNYVGFDADEEGINNLKFGISKERAENRMSIVRMIDRKDSQMDKAWTNLREQAYNIAMGRAYDAFDLTKESAEVQNMYKVKTSGFGKSLLMARRLVENGSRFVSLNNGGWDMHNNISDGFKNKGPELDWGLSTLIDDLKSRDMLESTLIVVTTEFGRTPKININSGRDHWNRLIPLLFIGGTANGTQYGDSAGDNSEPTHNPVTPDDLWWTIGNFLDIPKFYTVVSDDKRPHHLFKDDAKDVL